MEHFIWNLQVEIFSVVDHPLSRVHESMGRLKVIVNLGHPDADEAARDFSFFFTKAVLPCQVLKRFSVYMPIVRSEVCLRTCPISFERYSLRMTWKLLLLIARLQTR